MTAAMLIKNGGGFINLGHWVEVGGGGGGGGVAAIALAGQGGQGRLHRPHRSGDLGHCRVY